MRHSQPSAIRVLVAHSNPIHTQLLGEALEKDARLKVVCAATNSSEVIQGMVDHHPDVLLISAGLDDQPEGGLDVLKQLHCSHGDIKAIVLLDSSKPQTVVRAFRVGARGVFSRNDQVKTLCKCICVVHAGQIWANSEQLLVAFKAFAAAPATRSLDVSSMARITERERDVVDCLAHGLSNREIAQNLHISPHTVKNYVFRIFDKLGVSSRVELLFYILSGNQTDGSPSDAPGRRQNLEDGAESTKTAESHAERLGVLSSGTDPVGTRPAPIARLGSEYPAGSSVLHGVGRLVSRARPPKSGHFS